ncbi:MAG: hypothetical protein ABIT04_05660 [Novosphingobium sp.]
MIGSRAAGQPCYGGGMTGAGTAEHSRAKRRRGGVRGSIALLALSASACSSQGYPSLARRPAERVVANPAPAAQPSAEAGAANPQLSRQLAALLTKAGEGHRSFTARRSAVERAVAGAGALGSDSWASASIALAGLEGAHGGATAALVELDELATTHRIERIGASDPGTDAIETARAEVERLTDEEADVLARLQARLGG